MLVLLLLIASIASDPAAQLDLALSAAQYEGDDVASLQAKLKAVNERIASLQANTYTAGATKAVHDGQPLVTFLGCRSRAIAGAITSTTETLPGYVAPAVVVAVPGEGWLVWRATLHPDATDGDIRRAIAGPPSTPLQTAGKAVQPAAVPFSPPPAGRDDDLERGPWPAELLFPKGMVRYRRALNTQSIFISGISDVIQRVPRTQLDPHWQVSGGMEGLSGWRSDVYRNNAPPRVWVGNIEVKNGYTHRGFDGLVHETTQKNRGHLRSYPDGAKFLDVLSTDGTVFEVRQREKVKGVWESEVLYANPKARPLGYDGKTKRSCASCHALAGTGGYGAGLVPGGDTVLSDPFDELER